MEETILEPVMEEGQAQPKMSEEDFMESLKNLMSQLSEPCRGEFEIALGSQDMNLLTPGCKQELSQVASTTNQFEKAKAEGVNAAAQEATTKNGPQPDPYTKYYVFTTLLLFFVLIVSYIIWVNKKLQDAGLIDPNRKPKQLSKKKLEKQKAKQQQKTF